jgi:hypothetical protein
MPARTLGVAVVSTAHLEPAGVEGEPPPFPVDCLVRRVERLMLHLLGHLNGLGHSPDKASLMAEARAVESLDSREDFRPEELERLRRKLGEVADLRLEEQEEGARLHPWAFHLTVAWHNRADLWRNVRQLQPWLFPLRLSRLTLAGASALLVLLITAEAWDLGMGQSLPGVVTFALVSLVGSSLFVLTRQKLWAGRTERRLSEQAAVTNLSMLATVLWGMATTYAVMFALALSFSRLFFRPALERAWAATVDVPLDLERRLVFSGFVATLGLLIGALGASFEEETYFRHVAHVDSED